MACPRPGALPAGLSLPRAQKQDRVSACLLKDSLSSRPSGCSRTGRARRVSPKAVGAERTCSCGCGRRSGCSGRGTSISAWGHVIGQAHHWVSVAVEWCGEVPGGCRVTEGDPVCAHVWVSLSRRAQARSSLGVGPSAGQMCVEDMRGAWALGPRVPWEQPGPSVLLLCLLRAFLQGHQRLSADPVASASCCDWPGPRRGSGAAWWVSTFVHVWGTSAHCHIGPSASSTCTCRPRPVSLGGVLSTTSAVGLSEQ